MLLKLLWRWDSSLRSEWQHWWGGKGKKLRFSVRIVI